MKKLLAFPGLILLIMLMSCSNSDKQANQIWKTYPEYQGNDLGMHLLEDKILARVWAPPASELVLRIYENGHDGEALLTVPMTKAESGTWTAEVQGNWENHYYTFQARIGKEWKDEVPDPQARAVGVNGKRGMIVNLEKTNPDGWHELSRPMAIPYTDAVIWEIHVRDFSIHPSSGHQHPGKYLAFAETGTKSPEGLPTGTDHIRELGITHVHLLPVYDFATVDETRLDEPQYNWGYDPQNYNAPEGSYATDPYDGRVRIREFKEMVAALHRNGIRVVMDVVYNHMYDAASSPFEQLAPGYFFRLNEDGTYANGSGCGNETASERPMMRRFMIESLVYWAKEYHIDGFRFDLMGLHDIETMNAIREALDQVRPGILLYGEGWTAGDTPLEPELRAVKAHASRLNGIAVFSDDIRDAIRGHWYDSHDKGFMAGREGVRESIRFGVVASTLHPRIDYSLVNYSDAPYADSPCKTITYVTCHDNPCLYDKTAFTCMECSHQEKLDIQKLANAIVLTSQGIAFLHAGEELVRTKLGEHNTYNLPDSVNQLNWHNKSRYYHVFSFYRDMVALRRNHPAFRMTSSEQIAKHLTFIDHHSEHVVGFHIGGNANGDSWKDIVVYYNAGSEKKEATLPEGSFRVVASKYGINEKGVTTPGLNTPFQGKVMLPARSILVLADKASL